MCDKRDRAINCVFCRDFHFTLTFFGLLQKDLFKGRWCLAESILSLLSHKVWRLLSSPVLLRKFTNYHYIKTLRSSHFIPGPCFTCTQSAVRGLVVRSPRSVFINTARLKRFTLRGVMLQGYNKSILISEKTFSLIIWKRVGHDTGKLWLPVGVTFPLETAWRRHATRNTPWLQDDRHLVCSRGTSAFTLPSRHRYF